MLKTHIERNAKTPEKRWELFGRLLSNEMNPADLVGK
jgi:hypothetical protein